MAARKGRSEAAVGCASWSDARHGHHMSGVVDLVKDAVIAHADPKEPFLAGHRLDAMRTGVLLEAGQVWLEPLSGRKREPQEFALG